MLSFTWLKELNIPRTLKSVSRIRREPDNIVRRLKDYFPVLPIYEVVLRSTDRD